MLPLPDLRVLSPVSVPDALAMHRDHPGALFLAGGTDLVPNLKYGLHAPPAIVDLTALRGFRGVTLDPDGRLQIGALTTLHEVEASSLVRLAHPVIGQAAARVAAPQHRRKGTVGGNVLLDTRCFWYNAHEEWRLALGGCLKKDGPVCRVIGGPKRCVAATSGDLVPVFLALGAVIEFQTTAGVRTMPLCDLYVDDGRIGQHLQLPPGAFLRNIIIPASARDLRCVHRKVALREAIDFPLLSLAAAARFHGDTCIEVSVSVSAIWPRPYTLTVQLKQPLTEDHIQEISQQAFAGSHPLRTALGPDIRWRRQMARVETARALHELVGLASRG